MPAWTVDEAVERFCELLDACMLEGPQMVTREGAEAALLVSVQEWKRLQSTARPSLKQLLLAGEARFDIKAGT